MKITRVETVELSRSTEVHWGTIGWLWVHLYTDEGLIGLGETFPASAAEKAVVLHDLAPVLLGRDPRDIEALWHEMFLTVQYRGWAGAEMRAISAVDVALWDILGRSANLPLYRLLGGQCRDRVPIYNTCYDDKFDFNQQPVELAGELLAAGIRAMKIWPFDEVGRRNRGQYISKDEMEQCLTPLRKIREALGEEMQIAVEFHGFWNLPCAIKIAEALEPYKVMWLEEMLPQDNLAAYAVLAQKVRQPLTISERLLTRWGFREVLENRAASIIMPDLAWCGGLSEGKKIATWAETYYLPIAPHNCGGPVTHFASWHLATATPNLMILETVRRHYADRFVPIATSPGAPDNGMLGLPPGPGLGIELKPEFLAGTRVKIESYPGSA
jgi:L-alanine-DL-glutamate epimerase-like enolase superfamily enzyme